MKGLSITVVVGCTCAAALAQTDVLYGVDTFGTHRVYAMQGLSAINSAPLAGGSGEAAIAVYGDVRTSDFGSGGSGAKYDLGLNWTGTTYPFTGTSERYEGATDGTYNYAFAYPSSTLNRYDRNWQNEAFVCNVPNTDMAGITCDGSNGTFWGVSLNLVPTTVINFDSSGTVLSSFLTSSSGVGFSYQYGIAWEPSTDTLWTIEYAPSGAPELWQYDKTGAVLQHGPVAGLSDSNWGFVGIEFNMVPAPGSLALLGLGGLGAARRRRS